MRFLISFSLLIWANVSFSQELYFPANDQSEWANYSPEDLGWCSEKLDSLYAFLAEAETKAFLILKDGRIVLEKYFGTFTEDSIWYWASAGKTLTALTVGNAQEQGYLSLEEPTSNYLGQGWTSLEPAQEEAIRIRHQLTMTTGLVDDPQQLDCTDPECLTFAAEPGTRWAYHNAPYTLLREVVESATGKEYNVFFAQQIRNKIGMNGSWIRSGFNNVYFSNARSMARFGLLILNKGVWNHQDTLLSDRAYFEAMTTPSQEINPSYGYLWWLNGQDSHRLPRSQFTFLGPLVQNAPNDLIAGLGKNDQKLYVVPSQNLVVVRMGESSGVPLLAASDFDDQLWAYLSDLSCTTTTLTSISQENLPQLTHNPVRRQLSLQIPPDWQESRFSITSAWGQPILSGKMAPNILLPDLPVGTYFLQSQNQMGSNWVTPFMVITR